MKPRSMCLVAIVWGTLWCQAQTHSPAPLSARWVPGQGARYELEGLVHFTSGHESDVKLNIADSCSYGLHAVVQVDVEQASVSGALGGHVFFQAVRLSAWDCAKAPKPDLVQALRNLETRGVEFQINPAGDVRLQRPAGAGNQFEGVSMLLKSAWDLLQVHLGDARNSPEEGWRPSRRFLYWPDSFVEGLEIASASMRYARDVRLAGHTHAYLQYKHVFSPADMPAYVETRSRARDFTGTTFVAGKGTISLLFDPVSGRTVYLHRERTIDNRMMLKYEPDQTSRPLATFSVEEQTTMRWLPENNSEAWLAELHKFENEAGTGEVKAPPTPGSAPTSAADLAAASRKKPAGDEHQDHEISDLLDRPARGFERWERSYCTGPFCLNVSLHVPQGTREADSTSTTALLLSTGSGRTMTIAVGPILDKQYQGLAEDELLREQSAKFLASYLWFASGPGEQLNFTTSTVHDRPAALSDFTVTARDLTPIRGQLVLVLAPYERLIPITCSYPASQRETLDAICQTIAGSVVLR